LRLFVGTPLEVTEPWFECLRCGDVPLGVADFSVRQIAAGTVGSIGELPGALEVVLELGADALVLRLGEHVDSFAGVVNGSPGRQQRQRSD
jgi:hypothetical protein